MRFFSDRHKYLLTICEGGICISLAWALSYLQIPIGAQGGSVDFVMVPLILFSLRHGLLFGTAASLLLGTIAYFFTGGYAVSWVSIILDYILAYGAVGFAGLAKDKRLGFIWGTLLGGFARYFVHYLSGVTIYLEYAPETFLGMTMPSPTVYSIIYNGLYMIPNIVVSLIIVPIIFKMLKKARI